MLFNCVIASYSQFAGVKLKASVFSKEAVQLTQDLAHPCNVSIHALSRGTQTGTCLA